VKRPRTVLLVFGIAGLLIGFRLIAHLTTSDDPVPRQASPASSSIAMPNFPAPTPTEEYTVKAAEEVEGVPTRIFVPPRNGSFIAGRVKANPGELCVTVSCRGPGELEVTFNPMDNFAVPCGATVQFSKNQINLVKPHELKIVVSAPNTVRWSLRVQAP